MLGVLVSVVNYVKTAVYYGFYFSYKVGYGIVAIASGILSLFANIGENIFGVFAIISESLCIFLQDIVQAMQQVLVLIATGWETVFGTVTLVCLKISYSVGAVCHFITAVCSNVINAINYIYYAGISVFVFMKKAVIIFGSGVWFLITLIPIVLYYACILFTTFIRKFYEEFCDMWCSAVASVANAIKDGINFFLDVPVESVAGLIIAASLVYIFIQFYAIIGIYLKQQARKISVWVIRKATIVRNAVMQVHLSRISGLRQQNTNNQRLLITARPAQRATPVQQRLPIRNSPQKNLLLEDRCCVICQERVKCILLLPCRHLCLCTECTRELRYYNDVCPICRTDIESTMKIFV